MKAWALYKKEMRVYFTSPIAYAVFAVFTIVVGFFFFAVFNYYQLISQQAAMNPMAARDLSVTEGVLRPLFQNISVIMLFMLPIVTMRLFAEEKRSGSIELLLTFPIRDGEVLLGKYLAALSVMLGMLALTLAYPAMVASAAQLEWGTLLTGYLGLILQGAAFIAHRHHDLVADREPDRGRARHLRHAAHVLGDLVGRRGGPDGPAAGPVPPVHHRALRDASPRA